MFNRHLVVQAPWHVFLLGKNHDKTDFVYRMLGAGQDKSKLLSILF
jgi:hypothetical protein